MERRDYLEMQIEQMSSLLRKLLSLIIKTKSENADNEAINEVALKLKSELNLDLNQLLQLSDDEFKSNILAFNFADNHLETLSQMFFEIGISTSYKEQSRLYLSKSIELLNLADEVSNSLSLERINKKSHINNLITKL